MVNLFEQWNDMDFVSTYEPIDWKALNDFANRARQDAKDNADARAEKLKNLNEMYVTDINDDFTSEANDYIKSEIERISSLGTNMAPGDFSRDLNKNMSPVLAYQKGAQKQADKRREDATELNLDQYQIQAIDEATNLYNQDGRMKGNGANGFHYLKSADSWVADYVDKSKSERNDNGLTSTEAYNPGHWAEDVSMIPNKSDIMTGARLKAVLMLNDLGRYGEKSDYYELLKNHVVLNDDGSIKTTAKGTAILKDDFTGTGRYIPYMFKQKPKGSGFVSDEESPISFGNGIDALAREYIYGLGYNRTFGKINRQLPKDSNSGSRSPKLVGDDIDWIENVHNVARAKWAYFDNGKYEDNEDGIWTSFITDATGNQISYRGNSRPKYIDKETWDNEDSYNRAIMIISAHDKGEYTGWLGENSAIKYKNTFFSEHENSKVVTTDVFNNCGINTQCIRTTESEGDSEERTSTSTNDNKVTGFRDDVLFISEYTTFYSTATGTYDINGSATGVYTDGNGNTRLVVGAGDKYNPFMVLNTVVTNDVLRKIKRDTSKNGNNDPNADTLDKHMEMTNSVGVNALDKKSPSMIAILNCTAKPNDFADVIIDLNNEKPGNDPARNDAIKTARRMVANSKVNGRIDRVKLIKDLVGTWGSNSQEIRMDSPITFKVGVAIGSIAQDEMRDAASKQAGKNAGKSVGPNTDASYRTGQKTQSTK